ncbi:MAG TPA: hypothetical protein DCY50_01490 [Franconibacter helveticus]|nr:hypothetical protein [Franconibacter helveticus]
MQGANLLLALQSGLLQIRFFCLPGVFSTGEFSAKLVDYRLLVGIGSCLHGLRSFFSWLFFGGFIRRTLFRFR